MHVTVPLESNLVCMVSVEYSIVFFIFFFREVLPRLENCHLNPSGLVELFSFASPQMKSLYVAYCRGQKRSESILRENIDFFKV